MASQLRSALRAALVGLCLGLLLGGAWLFVSGVRGRLWPVDCAHLSPEACTVERATERDVARWQLFSGGALIALGVAIALRLRAR